MTQQMNVPKLRFGEFDAPLTKLSLEKLTTKISDGIHSTPSYDDSGDYFFVNGNNLKNGVIQLDKKTKKVSAKEAKKHYKNIDEQTILMSINGTIGNIAFYQGEPIMLGKSASYININPRLADKYFISNYLQRESTKYYFDTELTGSTIKNLSLKAIKCTPIVSPPLPEQQKIAAFLSKVDEKISLLTEKKAKLTEYKKGVMQQLFNGAFQTQDGKLVFVPPTLRFKADDGSEFPDWEEKRLGDVFSIGNGRDYKHLSEGDIPVFGTGGYMLSVNEFLHDGETVFIGRKGTINKPYMYVGKFWTVDTLFFTKDFKDVLAKFIYLVFQQINWSMYNEATGVPSLSKTTISKITFNFPAIEEQEKISNFVTAIDQKIDLTSTELDKAKEWKKGLLQQMFV